MSIETEVASLTKASSDLMKTVIDKSGLIDKRVKQFEVDAFNLVKSSTANTIRSNIGLVANMGKTIKALPNVDVSIAVKKAYSEGYKHVSVDWPADGQDRHWNQLVVLPVGATISIFGADSSIDKLGGSVRPDRACYQSSFRGGVSAKGSPMIFRNLEASQITTGNDYFKVDDSTSLLYLTGNNIVDFNNGTYLHDEGGMLMTPYSGGLIQIEAYQHGLTSLITGGGHFGHIFLSSSLVNHKNGSSGDTAFRFLPLQLSKTSSDGELVPANKGFRLLQSEGVQGVTADLFILQPYEVPLEKTKLNDVVHVGYNTARFSGVREVVGGVSKPRLLSSNTWSHAGGVVTFQGIRGFGEVSSLGFIQVGTSNVYLAGL